MMPIPQGEITTSKILVPEVLEEAIKEADAESAVEEYIVEKVKPAPRKRTKL
jgi:hypothetical protein